jgi:hypothetical protein
MQTTPLILVSIQKLSNIQEIVLTWNMGKPVNTCTCYEPVPLWTLFPFQLTNSRVQNPPWEATIFSAGQEFPYLYATWRFITVVKRAQTLAHTLVQISPGYTPSSYCFKVHFIAPPTQIDYKSEALCKISFCSLRLFFCHHAIPELQFHPFLAVSNFSINVFVAVFHILCLSLATATWGWAIMWSQRTHLT